MISINNKYSTRSKEAIKNIAMSIGARSASIVATLLLVPMTINYVNPTQYGIWLTLSQIIGWIAFFDLGLGNGFRNRFAQAKAEGNMQLARQYLSTTYFAISAITSIVFIVLFIGNFFIDWTTILKVNSAYRDELQKVFGIVCCFFCLNMVANIFSMLLTADQKPGIAAIIQGAGQWVSLGVIFILTNFTHGSLFHLALYFSGVPCIVMLTSSIYAFIFTRYKDLRPKISEINAPLIKDILGLGIQFFLIYLCMIAIFQVTNIVLSREIGPDAVTQYNIAFRYFNVLYSVMIIIITPFWSAFTDAYTKQDVLWMKSTVRKLEKTWALSVVVGGLMLAISPIFYDIWIGEKVHVPFVLSLGLLIYICCQTLGNVYMYLINGIGTIRIQLITYIFFAIIAWPMLTYSCRLFGIWGIVITPSLAYLAQAVLSSIQINKILNNSATGWWIK